MRHQKKTQTGFGIVQISLIVFMAVAIGLTGFAIINRQNDKSASDPTGTSEQSPAVEGVSPAPEIKSTEDLSRAEKAVDESQVEGSNDASELDAELGGF
jgi:hypothetical protein